MLVLYWLFGAIIGWIVAYQSKKEGVIILGDSYVMVPGNVKIVDNRADKNCEPYYVQDVNGSILVLMKKSPSVCKNQEL